MKTVWTFLKNWVEATVWLPLTMLSIYGLAWMAYLLTGRAPQVSMDFLPELGVNFFKIAAAIVFTSITKQALFGWLTMAQKLDSPLYAWGRMIFETIILLSYLYVLFSF